MDSSLVAYCLACVLRYYYRPESELRQAVRMQGTGDLSRVEAVVLETNGKLSVITSSSYGDGSALADVRGTEALGDDDRRGPAGPEA